MIDFLSKTAGKTVFLFLIYAVGLSTAPLAWSADWVLSETDSKIAFGSIKKDTVGEVHHFTGLSGSVGAAGSVSVEIDVTTVETFIDIRNERFLKLVFAAGAPKAVLNAKLDISSLEALKPGETMEMDIEGKLVFNSAEVPVETTMFVARLSQDKVLATTDEMIMLSTADLGIDAGIDQLQKIAKLASITRVTPVTLRLVFTR